MAEDESNQQRKVKFLQILLLMDSFEEEDVLRSRERVIWTRSWIRRKGEERGAYHQLFRELAVEDAPAFARYFRMDKEKFNDLVGRISIHIQRQDTIMRAAISPGERLAVTLRYLATGETFSSLEIQFRISRTAISKIVFEVGYILANVMYIILNYV